MLRKFREKHKNPSTKKSSRSCSIKLRVKFVQKRKKFKSKNQKILLSSRKNLRTKIRNRMKFKKHSSKV